MKLSLIGASGSVGQEIIRMSLFNELLRFSNLCFFYHLDKGKKEIVGMVNDVLVGNNVDNVKITSDINDLIDSDICILCAGKAIDTDITKIIKNGNNHENNREILYEENKDIILYWTKQIYTYSPSALIILVTNPVSRLLRDIYNLYPNIKAVGCGVTNDTLRVRNEFIKSFPNDTVNNLFVIGEHSLGYQTIALTYFNSLRSKKIDRLLFEKIFNSKKEKQTFISNLKQTQNCMLANNDFELLQNYNKSLPIIYKSYMTHRMSHFLFKTHLSTSIAIKEILEAYIFENKMVSVEVKCEHYLSYSNCILGVPIKFKNKQISVCDINIDEYEKNILLECENKFKLMEVEKR